MFSPALTDGSLGDMLYFHSYKNPGLILDIVEGKSIDPFMLMELADYLLVVCDLVQCAFGCRHTQHQQPGSAGQEDWNDHPGWRAG